MDGNVTVYEARLVAKSFSQVQGVDYDEVFSSVAMLKSVRIMLALAALMKSGRWMSKRVSLPVFVRKGCSAPTHFLVNTGLSKSLYKTICFDQLIKAYILTPRCLHQSIDGSLELAYFVSTFRIDKTFWLHHIQLFVNKSIKECSFVYPFARFHKKRQLLT